MKRIFFFLLTAAIVTACEKPVIEDEQGEDLIASDGSPVGETKKFTFTLKGDFSDEWKPVTRGYLQADGRDMTDIWVLDYDANGNLLQHLHQSDNTKDDFGKPVLHLKYGQHHVYFIVSRGTSPTLNTDTRTISFAKVYDTFYKDYEVEVKNTSNGNRAVTLDRVNTKLRLKFTDVIPDDAATINITPSKWYYGWNYMTGKPTDARASQEVVITIPDSEKGKTDVAVNVFGFSTAEQWSADVTFNAKRADGSVIGQATIERVPFKANRITEYAGKLFTSDGDEVALSLNSEWNETYHGLW